MELEVSRDCSRRKSELIWKKLNDALWLKCIVKTSCKIHSWMKKDTSDMLDPACRYPDSLFFLYVLFAMAETQYFLFSKFSAWMWMVGDKSKTWIFQWILTNACKYLNLIIRSDFNTFSRIGIWIFYENYVLQHRFLPCKSHCFSYLSDQGIQLSWSGYRSSWFLKRSSKWCCCGLNRLE